MYLSHIIIDSFPRILKLNFFKIRTSFVSPERPKARANQTSINFMIFILIFVENCQKFNAIHDLSVWLRTGSNPPVSNRFLSHTGKYITDYLT